MFCTMFVFHIISFIFSLSVPPRLFSTILATARNLSLTQTMERISQASARFKELLRRVRHERLINTSSRAWASAVFFCGALLIF